MVEKKAAKVAKKTAPKQAAAKVADDDAEGQALLREQAHYVATGKEDRAAAVAAVLKARSTGGGKETTAE